MDMDQLLDLADDFGKSGLLKPQDRDSFESSSYAEVQRDMNQMQSQQLMTKTMMNLTRIYPFLEGMAHLEKTLNALAFRHTERVMAYVWGPVRFLLKTTNPDEKAFDNILDLYEMLGSEIPPLFQYMRLFTSLPESEACLIGIYQDVIEFHQLAYKLFSLRSKLWQKIRKATWADLDGRFDHLARSLKWHGQFIREHGSLVQNPRAELDHDYEGIIDDAEATNVLEWANAKAELNRYRNDRRGRRKDFEEAEEERKEKQKNEVITWISPSTKTDSLHQKLQDMRCRDTGRWLFRRYRAVKYWMEDDQPPDSAIWIQGNRGFGKTVLASMIVEELKALPENKKCPIPKDSNVCYFYCQEGDPDHSTRLGILREILHQMVSADDYLTAFCADKISTSGNKILENEDTAQNMIEAFCEYSSRQYIIIDGLDECEHKERSLVAEFFAGQVAKCDNDIKQGRLRVLYISRPMDDMPKENVMPEDDGCIILKSTDNADDIRTYVRHRIPEFAKPHGTTSGFNLSSTDEQDLEAIVCHRSEDMFLYAYLAIEYLLKSPTKGHLIERMREEILPAGISQIYEKLLEAIKTKLTNLEDENGEIHWEMAKRLLSWLICAKRPLIWHEMQAILSYDSDTGTVDFDNKMLRKNVSEYLGSLVHVLKGNYIRLIHSSARQYIAQNALINRMEVQCDLATNCLTYLCLDYFSTGVVGDEDEDTAKEDTEWRKLGALRGDFAFQDYACSQWHAHIETIMSDCGSLFDGSSLGHKSMLKFGSALRLFISTHEANLTANIHPDLGENPLELDGFRALSFYHDLRFLWNHIYTHQKAAYDVRNTVGIAQIDAGLRKNRQVLESYRPSQKAFLNDTMEDYYGSYIFKCKQTLCKFFYLGYDREKYRDKHHTRHDRPYPCPVSCHTALTGFSSRKDRDRHVRTYHPEMSEEPTVFEALSRRTDTAGFSCRICHKTFTRNINLKGHERSHFGDRPFSCPACGKAFTRMSDCRRHERIHARRGI